MDAAIGGAKLALAIELYDAHHGEHPASLDDLVPGFLPELPVDPLADDGRFGYRLLTDDPHARRYLLYSTGLDGEDNGGVTQPYVDMMSPSQDDGFDVILNLPRAEPESGGDGG
jgi:hypothetical protein